jgi:hypothetical protein
MVDAVSKAASKLIGEQLKKANADAIAKRDHLAGMLIRFQLDLDNAEEIGILLRSRR